MAYCNTCRRTFRTDHALSQHVRDSPQHQKLKKANKDRAPLPKELHPAPRSTEIIQLAYKGEAKTAVRQVWRLACHHLKNPLNVEQLIALSDTMLNSEIVRCILDAALKLVPPDNSTEGIELRRQKEKRKQEKALQAEKYFIAQLGKKHHFVRENDIRQAAVLLGDPSATATPDVLFTMPVNLFSRQCHWIEYKSYFGFKKAPYKTASEKKQAKKYVDRFGPGIIVFKHGFEEDHLRIDGLQVLREFEFLEAWNSEFGKEETASDG